MLEGLRIVEIEGLGPAPFAGMMLADMGADVIVIHRPRPPVAGLPEQNLLDRGKRSIVLNLKDENDCHTLKKLVTTTDGLIEGFRPGVMERLGLGPDDLFDIQPKLVYGRMTGWGQDGPKSQDAGHDLNYIALSGALWYASQPEQPPFPPPTIVGDIGGGALYLVAGMLAGLLRAQRTGKGTVVDAAIVDGSAHMMNLLMSMAPTGRLKPERGQSLLDGPHWSRCYACADKQWISVQCLEPKFYAIFLKKLGLDTDPNFSRQYDQELWPELTKKLEIRFASKPVAYWDKLFENSDACVAPVYEPTQSGSHPHIASRDIWKSVDGNLQAAAAPRFDGIAPSNPTSSPVRGEHSEEILHELEGD